MPDGKNFVFKESGSMNQPPYEKYINYGETRAHIRIPENPTGLVFIAPGTDVAISDPLMRALCDACAEKGQATVLADIGKTPHNTSDPFNVQANFVSAMQSIIDGYSADNNYMPAQFELIGHSIGGAAVLSLAKDNPVSQITVLDPVPVNPDILKTIECPAHFILSNVRSFRAVGERMFNQLVGQTDTPHTLHKIDTSKERDEGHYFRGKTTEVKDILSGNNGVSEPDVMPDIEPKNLS